MASEYNSTSVGVVSHDMEPPHRNSMSISRLLNVPENTNGMLDNSPSRSLSIERSLDHGDNIDFSNSNSDHTDQ